VTALVEALTRELNREPIDLARAALAIARLEYPGLEPDRSLARLDRLGALAVVRLRRARGGIRAQIRALNGLIFDDEGFAGDRAHYDDCRNSCLNAVLDRRLGIPITLALVYMEVARRAGLDVQGVSFPGHFLMRVPDPSDGGALILDPFNAGAELDDSACAALLLQSLGGLNVDLPLDPALLRPCGPRDLLARMLNNLKRSYVAQRQYPQARAIAALLLAVDPLELTELRDRGLLAYHLDDYAAALRDLQTYLRLAPAVADREDRDERQQIRDHIKSLRRRLATLN
jgi:regulator of sirC expression with transglutaminase-like and TPR domain